MGSCLSINTIPIFYIICDNKKYKILVFNECYEAIDDNGYKTIFIRKEYGTVYQSEDIKYKYQEMRTKLHFYRIIYKNNIIHISQNDKYEYLFYNKIKNLKHSKPLLDPDFSKYHYHINKKDKLREAIDECVNNNLF